MVMDVGVENFCYKASGGSEFVFRVACEPFGVGVGVIGGGCVWSSDLAIFEEGGVG